jgi:hypothetical protein
LRRGEESAPLRFPAQADLLEAALAQAGAKLVMIDPILAFLDQGIATANDQSVRRALTPPGPARRQVRLRDPAAPPPHQERQRPLCSS